MSGPGPQMSALSAYMSAAGTRALPAEAAEHAKHHLLDTLASMISGSELLPGQAAQGYIRTHGGKGAATIAGTPLTAAPGDAAGLDARQMRWALDYTAQQSSGIVAWRRDTDHIEKAFVFGGMPARNGVTAALVVRTGWNGVDDIFSGSDNFFLAYAPKAQPERLVEKLGERYEIVQTDIKKWTVGSPIQGPLDALETLRQRNGFDANRVQRVVVRLAPTVAGEGDNRQLPDICPQHLVAVMVL